MTPSQNKKIEAIKANPEMKVLAINKGLFGVWIVKERLTVRKTKKHKPPFKYAEELYGPKGALLLRRSGNQWDGVEIIDNFTETGHGHMFGYRPRKQ